MWTKHGNWAAGGSVDRDDNNVNNGEGGGGHHDDNNSDNDHDNKGGGGCKGTAHPGVGTTYDIIVIANTRSSLTTTSALSMAVMMAILAAVWGGLV